MGNQAFFNYLETRAKAGYGSAILVKDEVSSSATFGKYVFLISSVVVPSVYGSVNSFEFDLLNSPVVGKIPGKTTLEDKDVEYLYHRDNIIRLGMFRDKVCDFMVLYPDMTAWKFTGSIRFRPNDASAEALMGTYTITPMSADDHPIENARGMFVDTVLFAEEIPDHIDGLTTTGVDVSCETNPTGASISCQIYDFVNGVKATTTSTNFTAEITRNVVKLKQATGASAGTHYAIAYITATMSGYSKWTTTIAISTTKA